MHVRRRAACAAALALLVPPAGGLDSLEFSLGDIAGPDFSARGLTARVALGGAQPALQVDVANLEAFGRRFQDLRLTCRQASAQGRRLGCADGELRWQDSRYPLAFTLDLATSKLDATARVDDGVVQAHAEWAQAGAWRVEAEVRALPFKRLAGLLPATLPAVSAGTLDATLSARGGAGGPVLASGTLTVAALAFSDAAGLHAGEGIGAGLDFSARSAAGGWEGEADLAWRRGEVFWQPLYLRAGHRLRLSGRLSQGMLEVAAGTLEMQDVGRMSFRGRLPLAAPAQAEGRLEADSLDARGLYAAFVQPLFPGGALADLEVAGRIGLALERSGGELRSAELHLDGVGASDRQGRFAFEGLDGRLPWSAREPTRASLGVVGGRVLQLAFGAFTMQPRLQGGRFQVPELRVPLLGGELSLVDLEAAHEADGWRWQVSGGLSPVPLEGLCEAFGWPRFAGSLAAGIPQVRYRQGRLTMDGGLLVQAFDGSAVIERLAIADPLGLAPRLTADVDMRRLDLELLTRAFSFGRITGRLDVSVKELELSQWKPVAFDARVASSPGDDRRRISQRAVENISALGGAGAAAALQRTFLRFFDDFGYRRLGMSCVLRNGVCEMGGVADAPQGYVIVEGGGIPAITVLGYNRRVDWRELVERLARITRSGPVVQ